MRINRQPGRNAGLPVSRTLLLSRESTSSMPPRIRPKSTLSKLWAAASRCSTTTATAARLVFREWRGSQDPMPAAYRQVRSDVTGIGSIKTTGTAPSPMSRRRRGFAAIRTGWASRPGTTTTMAIRISTSRTTAGTSCIHNNGDGTFTDVTEKAGVGAGGWSAGACFVDYDRDGKAGPVRVALSRLEHRQESAGAAMRPDIFDRYCHPEVFKPSRTSCITTTAMARSPMSLAEAGLVELAGQRSRRLRLTIRSATAGRTLLSRTMPFRSSCFGTITMAPSPKSPVRRDSHIDEDGTHYSGMGMSFEDYNNDGCPTCSDRRSGMAVAMRCINNDSGLFEYVTRTTGVGDIACSTPAGESSSLTMTTTAGKT